MKKIVSVLVCVIVAASFFAACSKDKPKNDATTTVAASVQGQTVSKIDVKDAKIKEADAIYLISSYSAKELSLSDEEMKKVSFLVNSSGREIDGDKYVMVIAAIKNSTQDKDGKTHITLEHKGEYFIRYDGKQILKKDMSKKDKEEYSELKVKAVPTTKAHKHDETTTAQETTKK